MKKYKIVKSYDWSGFNRKEFKNKEILLWFVLLFPLGIFLMLVASIVQIIKILLNQKIMAFETKSAVKNGNCRNKRF